MERSKYSRKVKLTSSVIDIYKFFKKKHPEHNLTQSEHSSICKEINIRLSNAMIKDSLELRMPFRLGFLRIKSYRSTIKFTDDGKLDTRKNAIDWKSTKDLWKELYPGKTSAQLKEIPNKKLIVHVNEHSNGEMVMFNWDKRISNVRNQSFYKFKAVKGPQDDKYYENEDCLHYGRRGLSRWVSSDDRINEYYN